ncbi:MAG: hypothetical protein JWS10_2594 [Cypionkella sp.]|uniref:hypothetical protein n=1 Tax=Cypionkella sp. TaxID=2811411 RepID=UPI0026141440|nr:hypothetical protein [Cypionkella sp.]MDB5659979.1 hypothetical protein [Cypionkella sp.]
MNSQPFAAYDPNDLPGNPPLPDPGPDNTPGPEIPPDNPVEVPDLDPPEINVPPMAG